MDIDLDVHIKVFKKAIKVNGEIMEADIINLFGFTFRNNIAKWVKVLFKTTQIAHLKSWSNYFVNNLEL
jgi:hypothetical protein